MEVGPRALGHRSIICDPSVKGIKDKLNADVKHREFYRPFAPIVLEEHLEQYFEREDWSNLYTMSYAIKAKVEFESKFSAACHVDGTARIQIVEKDTTLDILLSKLEPFGIEILANSSLNVSGDPTCFDLIDGLMVCMRTPLRYLLTDFGLLTKKL